MKRLFTLCIGVCTLMTGFAQTDSTKSGPDTIQVGGMVIIREKGSKPAEESHSNRVHIPHRSDKPSNISTNWWIVDIGFSNYNDKTNPLSQAALNFAGGAYAANPEWASLLTGKSRNINIWVFMQRLNLVNHVVNLKYGVGVELNNYFYDDVKVRYLEHPTTITSDPDLATAKKNKLAADYVTVPLMLNFNFTPERRNKTFGISVGVSAGYLYSARQKTKMNGDGDVSKTHGTFDLEHWKLSYVGELLLGPVKLYGSYAFQSMWNKGLDQTPYTVGFRISTW